MPWMQLHCLIAGGGGDGTGGVGEPGALGNGEGDGGICGMGAGLGGGL